MLSGSGVSPVLVADHSPEVRPRGGEVVFEVRDPLLMRREESKSHLRTAQPWPKITPRAFRLKGTHRGRDMYLLLHKIATTRGGRLVLTLCIALIGGIVIALNGSSGQPSSAVYTSLPGCVQAAGDGETQQLGTACLQQLLAWCSVHEPKTDPGTCSADALMWVTTNG